MKSAALAAARTARERLAEVMSAMQESADVPQVVSSRADDIAKVIGDLYGAETQETPELARKLHRSLDHLRRILQSFQDVPVTHPSVEATTSGIARTLAVLYPAAKELERLNGGGSTPAGPESGTHPKTSIPAQSIAVNSSEGQVIPLERKRSVKPPPPAGAPTDKDDPRNRRRAERVALEADIGFQSETNFFTGFAEDLSDGGIFVATYNVLPIGTELTISFVLPGGYQITAEARVAWVRDLIDPGSDLSPGMGLQFHDLSAEDQRAVMNFVHKRAPLFYDV